MNLKYYEKVMIAVVLFIGTVIFTSYTIGVFNNNRKPINKDGVSEIILQKL